MVKSHGSTDRIGFANAIKVAISLVENKINEQITSELKSSASALHKENNKAEEGNKNDQK